MINIGKYIEMAINWLTENFAGLFDVINHIVGGFIDGFQGILMWVPFYLMIAGIAALAWWKAGKGTAAFDEAAECGTAAVIAPISQIDDLDVNKSYVIAKDGKPGPVCEKLYNKLRAIQYGDEPDTYGWITIIE